MRTPQPQPRNLPQPTPPISDSRLVMWGSEMKGDKCQGRMLGPRARLQPVAQSLRPEHIDLFDGPTWDATDFWDSEPKPHSRWNLAGQLIASFLACMAIPACFAGVLGAFLWGFDSLLSFRMF